MGALCLCDSYESHSFNQGANNVPFIAKIKLNLTPAPSSSPICDPTIHTRSKESGQRPLPGLLVLLPQGHLPLPATPRLLLQVCWGHAPPLSLLTMQRLDTGGRVWGPLLPITEPRKGFPAAPSAAAPAGLLQLGVSGHLPPWASWAFVACQGKSTSQRWHPEGCGGSARPWWMVMPTAGTQGQHQSLLCFSFRAKPWHSAWHRVGAQPAPMSTVPTVRGLLSPPSGRAARDHSAPPAPH